MQGDAAAGDGEKLTSPHAYPQVVLIVVGLIGYVVCFNALCLDKGLTIPLTALERFASCFAHLDALLRMRQSTFAEALQQFRPDFHRCNQDELGNRRRVEEVAKQHLQQGESVCIDRTNINARSVKLRAMINTSTKRPDRLLCVPIILTPFYLQPASNLDQYRSRISRCRGLGPTLRHAASRKCTKAVSSQP